MLNVMWFIQEPYPTKILNLYPDIPKCFWKYITRFLNFYQHVPLYKTINLGLATLQLYKCLPHI